MTIEQFEQLWQFVSDYKHDAETLEKVYPHIYGNVEVNVANTTGTININSHTDEAVLASSYFVCHEGVVCNYPYQQIKSVFLIKKWPNQFDHTELEIK